MAQFSKYTGKNPEDLLGLCDGSPHRVLQMLHEFMYPPYIEECRVPLLTLDVDPYVTFESIGVAHRGHWYPLRRGKARRAPLIIHWPSLIRNLPTILNMAPAVALMLWLFKDLFYRRSYFVGETLQRKLLRNACAFYPALSPKAYPPLAEEDEVLLSHWLERLAGDREFIYALRTTFGELLSNGLAPKDSSRCLVRYRSKRGVSGVDCSVLNLGWIPVHRDTVPKKIELHGVDSERFSQRNVETLLYELLYAAKMTVRLPKFGNRYIPSKYGVLVATRPHEKRTKRILAINFSKFYPHRAAYDPHRYKRANPKYETKFTSESDVVMFLASYIEEHYPSLRLPWSTYEFKEAFFGPGQFWENDQEWANTVFLDLDALVALGVKHRRMDEHVKPRRKLPKAKNKKGVWRVPIHEDFYARPNTMESYYFKMIYHRGQVLFTSPWEIASREKQTDLRPYKGICNFRPKEGAFYFETLGEWFFTLDFLKYSPSFFGTSVSGLLDWLEAYHKKTHREFKALFKKEPKRRRGRPRRSNAFTEEQDAAIIALYRPVMSDEAKNELTAVCGDWTSTAISRRAATLRDSLIAQGVYDINELPHRQYNAPLRRRLKEEKAKARWVREKDVS